MAICSHCLYFTDDQNRPRAQLMVIIFFTKPFINTLFISLCCKTQYHSLAVCGPFY